MILWGIIAMVTPFCGFLIWHIHKDSHYANFISSLPFAIFLTEWYLTVFTGQYWLFGIAKDELLLSIAYLCFIFSLTAVVPTNKKRLCSLFYGGYYHYTDISNTGGNHSQSIRAIAKYIKRNC